MIRRIVLSYAAVALFFVCVASVAQPGQLTLYQSIVEGRSDALLSALQANLDPNARLAVPGTTQEVRVLDLAIRAGNVLRAGANVEAAPVLAGAAMNCAPSLVAVYLDAGVDPNQIYGDRTVAQHALGCFDKGLEEEAHTILEQLRSRGVDLCRLNLDSVSEDVRRALSEIQDCR